MKQTGLAISMEGPSLFWQKADSFWTDLVGEMELADRTRSEWHGFPWSPGGGGTVKTTYIARFSVFEG